jgi:hypothetical protein
LHLNSIDEIDIDVKSLKNGGNRSYQFCSLILSFCYAAIKVINNNINRCFSIVYLFRFCIFLLFTLCSQSAKTQPFYTHHPEYNFENFQISQGDFYGNFVRDVYQDEIGFIWVCTLNGLYRFDGYEYRPYKKEPQNPYSISGNNPIKIVGKGKDGFWVAINTGGILL